MHPDVNSDSLSPGLERVAAVVAVSTEEWDVDLPLDVPVEAILARFKRVEEFGLKNAGGADVEYCLYWVERARRLTESETLRSCQFDTGNTLRVLPARRVFISYAREDERAAQQVFSQLKKSACNPWLDVECLLPGQRWQLEIAKQVKVCEFFLALVSTKSVSKRGYVQKEIREALDVLDQLPPTQVFVIPARLDECKPLHPKLRELHWVDLFPSVEKGVEKILQTIIPEIKRDVKKPAADNLGSINTLPLLRIDHEALEAMFYTAANTQHEVGGFLIGNRSGGAIDVNRILTGYLPTISTVELTGLEAVVGHWHSHPCVGVFLSGADIAQVRQFPDLVSVVVDPYAAKDSVGAWGLVGDEILKLEVQRVSRKDL